MTKGSATVSIIAVAGDLAHFSLPIPYTDLMAVVNTNRSLHFDNEKKVAQWIIDTDITTLEKPISLERLSEIKNGDKRSSFQEDKAMVDWVLTAWTYITKHLANS